MLVTSLAVYRSSPAKHHEKAAAKKMTELLELGLQLSES